MSDAVRRYGRRGGGWLPKDFKPGDWVAAIARMRADAGDRWPNPDAARDAGVDEEGLARMARARMAAGIELSDADRRALRRHPHPRSCFFVDDQVASDESGDAA